MNRKKPARIISEYPNIAAEYCPATLRLLFFAFIFIQTKNTSAERSRNTVAKSGKITS